MTPAENIMDFISSSGLDIDAVARNYFDEISSLYDINKGYNTSSTSISLSDNTVNMISMFTDKKELVKFYNVVHNSYIKKYDRVFTFDCQINGFVVTTTVTCIEGDNIE